MGAEWWEADRRELERFGEMLDRRSELLKGRTPGEFLAWSLLRVRGKDGKLHRLKPNAVQAAYERRLAERNIVLKARQMGMTTWVAGRFLLRTMTRPGTVTLQVAQTQAAAEKLFGMVHRFVENLPERLNKGALRRSRSSARQIVFAEMDSEFRVISAADRGAGRGMTYQNLHCSEVAFWPGDADEVLAGLMAGLAPGGEMVLESTPNGVGGCFYEQWQMGVEAVDGERWAVDSGRDVAGPGVNGQDVTGQDATAYCGRMVRHFFPWWMEKGYRAAAVDERELTEDERGLVERHGLELEQIGYRRMMRSGMGARAKQEYAESAEQCFVATGEPYFEMEAIARRLETAPSEATWRRNNGQVEIWMPPLPGREYVVAVDPAGGGSEGDNSAIQVVDLEGGLQCAEYAGHKSGSELAELVREIAWDYGAAEIVVERNNHGSGVLWLLQQMGYRHIFIASDKQAGLLTTAWTKPQMLARMGEALRANPEVFYSRKLLAECRSFVRMANGGLGARNGAHDDRVMALALALEARAQMLGRKKENRDQRSEGREQRAERRDPGMGGGFA